MNSVEVVKNGDVLNINNQPVTSNNHQDEDKTNVASKSGWKKQPKHWKFKIICLYANFMTLGFHISVLGTSLVDLEELFNVDTKTISFVFTGTGLGYLVGSFLCGFVYDHFNYEAQFFFASSAMGVACAIAPWTGNMVAFMVICSLQNIAAGFIDAAGQAYVLHVMAGNRLQEPFMQAAHASWSLGATIEPFIIQPFLREKSNQDSKLDIENVTSTTVATNATSNIISTPSFNIPRNMNVKNGYLLTGLIVVLFSLLYLVAWCIGPKYFKKPPNQTRVPTGDPNKEETSNKPGWTYQILCLSILFLSFFTQVWIETGLGNYVAAFAIKALQWSKRDASWVTSALWGSQFAGRIIAIPISVFISPRTMVIISVVGTACSAGVMMALVKVSDIFYWISVVLAGVNMSSTFGSMVLWSSHHIPVTGVTSSVFQVGSSLGSLIGPVVTGHLFDDYSPMFMVYLLFAAASLQVLAVLVFNVFTYYFPRKYQCHGKVEECIGQPETNISFVDPSKL